MSEFEHSLTVSANPDAVFDFVSDVHNLPKYLPTVHNAEPQQGERVRVQGKAAGHSYDSDGHFKVDRNSNRMEWGSDGETAYSGWLQVDGDGRQSSKVTVHLSFAPRPDQAERMDQQTGNHDDAIREGLQKALESIKNEVEGKGGKVLTSADR